MSDVVVVGFAGLWVWYLIAHSTLLEKPLAWPREHWALLIGCPWCAGAWIVLIILLVSGNFDPLTWLAAAGFVGAVGSMTA